MNKPLITKVVMARYLSCSIPDAIWEYAEQEQMVSEANNEPREDPKKWLGEHLKRLLELRAEQPHRERVGSFAGGQRRVRREKSRPLRLQILSEVLAAVAGNREDVLWFRNRVLGGRLIEHEEVGEWIKARQNEAEYQRAIVVKLPLGIVPELDKNAEWKLAPDVLGSLPIENILPREFLAFSYPEGQWVERAEVGRDGVLAQLQHLSKSLARLFTWQEAQATVFVLAGKIPLLSGVKVTVEQGPITQIDPPRLEQLFCIGRITLELDPLLSPREVMAHYERLRRKVISKKSRSLSERHMRLASFCAGREINRDTLTEWNQANKQWHYDRLSVFAFHAKTARQRLLKEPTFRHSWFD